MTDENSLALHHYQAALACLRDAQTSTTDRAANYIAAAQLHAQLGHLAHIAGIDRKETTE